MDTSRNMRMQNKTYKIFVSIMCGLVLLLTSIGIYLVRPVVDVFRRSGFKKETIQYNTKAPVLSNIVTTIKSATLLGISWVTNEPATSQVFYGTSTIDTYNTATPQVASGTLRTSHSLDVPVLSTTTPQHFVIQSVDAEGNIRTSAEYSVFLPF